MRFARNGVRVTAMALAVTAMVTGCTGGTPASRPASAHPVAAAGGPGARAGDTAPVAFAASLSFGSARTDRGDLGQRIALLSSRNGDLLRWLTPRRDGTFDTVLSVHDGWVYFVRELASASIWRVPVAGGTAQLIQAGTADYAISPDGHAVAYVISADHGDVLELVARNLATGRQNTIIDTKPSPDANNWPPGVFSLTWAPDDVHLAIQFSPTAAINSVLVLDAFTATALGDGRTAPAPCLAGTDCTCGEFDPAYLASGALTYIIQRISGSGAANAKLVAWRAGRRTTLLAIHGGAFQGGEYDMSRQGQAIWVLGLAEPKGPWTIWRWSGGIPVQIAALPRPGVSPYDGVGGIAW